MKSALLVLGVAAGALVSNAYAQEDLAKKYNCFACHAVDKKVVGPAYKDVAAKFRNDPKAPAELFERVKKGSSGVWGPVPMPPNAHVPDADIKKLVSWILSLK